MSIMKIIYRTLSLFLIVSILYSCDNSEGENEGKFESDPETGWVQFAAASSAAINIDGFDTSSPLEVPVEVNVPVVRNDLNIGYQLVGVSGADPNTVFSNNGQLVNPGGTSSHFDVDFPTINFDISEAAAISEPLVFDVVLTSTSSGDVTVGIEGSTRPISHRIEICPSLSSSVNTFIGDYRLTVPSGASAFGVEVFTENQIVTLSEGPNGPFSRQFTTVYLPAFQADTMEVSFLFVNGSIRVDNNLNTDIGCTSFILLGGNFTNIQPAPCGDAQITLEIFDFFNGTGGCGPANIPITVVLEKI